MVTLRGSSHVAADSPLRNPTVTLASRIVSALTLVNRNLIAEPSIAIRATSRSVVPPTYGSDPTPLIEDAQLHTQRSLGFSTM
jgi:hypothetical protein